MLNVRVTLSTSHSQATSAGDQLVMRAPHTYMYIPQARLTHGLPRRGRIGSNGMAVIYITITFVEYALRTSWPIEDFLPRRIENS